MPVSEDSRGKIDISSAAIITIVNQSVHQCYGVVGMANKNLVDGLANVLSRDSRRGIDIHIAEDGQIVVDVYVIVEYGVRIKIVAQSIQNTVKFHVEKAIGIPVKAVNIFVQGLRVSHQEGKI